MKRVNIGITPQLKNKVQISAATPSINTNQNVRVVHMQTSVITNTYMERKSFQSIYEEIFKLLMRLPDKSLQQRVIDAINGRCDKSTISNANQCKQCLLNVQKTQKVNISTQTETIETKETRSSSPASEITKETTQPIGLSKECPEQEPISIVTWNSPDNESTKKTAMKAPRKRGRKRNTCVPQVVKQSVAQLALQEREQMKQSPLPPSKRKKVENSDILTNGSNNSTSFRSRVDSISSNFSGLDGIDFLTMCDELDNYVHDKNQVTIAKTMAKEFIGAHIMSDQGLLPVHDAILVGDTQRVQRQFYVWTKMRENVDPNELLSADGEDCLQLALTNDCAPEIVKIVLNAGVLPNHVYEDSNTVLHLAIINNVPLQSLRELMLQIDLNILLKTNDDGYTPLHIAVRHNCYRMAEVICDTIDERQLGAPIYRRVTEEVLEANSESGHKNGEARDEKRFAKYYENACDTLENNREKLMSHQLKLNILNAIETRGGNGSLFYAIEGELEHLCYFLLAHLSNPDEENLSGQSPKSYHYEFTRILRINLKISRVMDKVIGILNGTSS